ncbi:hypothetical protein BKA62DRAFT_723669, partial [Auriculariales sp. MPI-PUGE-AT-0066]
MSTHTTNTTAIPTSTVTTNTTTADTTTAPPSQGSLGGKIRGAFGAVHGAGEVIRGQTMGAADALGDVIAGRGTHQCRVRLLHAVELRSTRRVYATSGSQPG